MGEEECIQDIVGKPEGEKPLGRSKCRWVDNIIMDHGKNGMVWIGLMQKALVNTILNFRVP
jgi:hypothetical protein